MTYYHSRWYWPRRWPRREHSAFSNGKPPANIQPRTPNASTARTTTRRDFKEFATRHF